VQDTFRIGEAYHVEPSLNRVTGPNGSTRLEPKVMLVLVCLADRAGQMVPKDRLLRAAWPDTEPVTGIRITWPVPLSKTFSERDLVESLIGQFVEINRS